MAASLHPPKLPKQEGGLHYNAKTQAIHPSLQRTRQLQTIRNPLKKARTVELGLTIIKENSPTSFAVEQTVQTIPHAKTCTLDTNTNHIILTQVRQL